MLSRDGYQWLAGRVSDFQKNLCFGLKLADRVVDFQKKADSWVFSLLCFADLKAPIHDYPSRLSYTSKTILLSRMNELISGENFIHASRTRYRLIMMQEKQKKSLKGPLTSFTLKACSIKKRLFRYLVN